MRDRWRFLPWMMLAALWGCGGGGGAAAPAAGSGTSASTVPLVIYNRDNSGQTDIYAVRADGTGTVALATSSDSERALMLVGDRLVYRRTISGQSDLYSVKLDGTGTAVLANSTVDEIPIGMAGSRFAYFKQNGSAWDLYTINLDGTGRLLLASSVQGSSTGGGVQIVGDQIIFGTTVGTLGLYVIHADGTGLLTLYPSTTQVYPVSYLAVPGKALFYRSESSGQSIHIVNLNGTGHAQLTPAGLYFMQQVVGGRLLYLLETLSTYPYRYALYSVNLDGTDARGIATNAAKDTRILQVANGKVYYDVSDSSVSEVYMANSDGTGVTPVSPIGQVYHIAGTGLAGDHLVLVKGSYSAAVDQLFSVGLDGTGLTALTAGTEGAYFAGYDGSRIYYVLYRASQYDLFSTTASGASTLTLGASPSLNESYPLTAGGWLAYAPYATDGSGITGIVTMKADGSHLTTVATGPCELVFIQ